MNFKITLKETGEYPTHEWLIKQDWYEFDHRTKTEGFAILEDGDLIFLDSYGSSLYVDPEPFKITWSFSVSWSKDT